MGTAVHASSHGAPRLGFTPEQIAVRRNTLGGSEIAAVAGLNSFSSPVAIWGEKLGLIPSFEGNQYTEWGQRLEGAIRQKYAEVTGAITIETPDTVVDPENPWRSCTPDGIVCDVTGTPHHGLECKRFGEHRMDDFGPAGTDQVPVDVAAQCYWNMDILKLPRWDVAVLLGQADFRTYSIAYDAYTAKLLFDAGHHFWHTYVLPKVEPPLDGTTSAHEYLAKRYRTNSEELLTPTPDQIELGRQLRGVKTQISELEFTESGLAAQLKAAIGNAAGLAGVATWKAPRVGAISWKAIAEDLAKRAGLSTAEFNGAVAEHTGEPSRRFVCTMKEG